MTWPPLKREPGELYVQAQGKTVEIVEVEDEIECEHCDLAVTVIAYRFLGGTHIYLRDIESTKNWQKVAQG